MHIPFCKQKCFYCDFISYAGKENFIKEYVCAIKNEIEKVALSIKEEIEINTIYIGGGTPSIIDSKYITKILKVINNNFKVMVDAEITIELNPGTVIKEKLEDYKRSGINRLSIGLQSTQDSLLEQIGRIHNYEQFLNTYKLARKVGFKNINIDLMLALPNQTLELLEDSIHEIIKLNPEHISVYSLILEEKTKLYNLVQNKVVQLIDENLERKMYWRVKEILHKNGYIHYEISNFAKKGYESRHNMNCWGQEQYIGFGVAAHSYFNNVRYSNVENIEDYIKIFNTKEVNIEDVVIIHEKQSIKDMQKEYMMLGLRKIDGVKISEFKNKFIQNPLYIFRNELNKLVNEGLLEIDDDSIKLTNKGLDLANIVFSEFV